MSTDEAKNGVTRRAVIAGAALGAAAAALLPGLAGAQPLPRPPVTRTRAYAEGVFAENVFAENVFADRVEGDGEDGS